ncbi:ankyrin repeat-containing protein [Reticulomyxa filosa]|uniref:Ankyrin repeat-containing protein n=1 Tax=Reticulomyxa filosa TaxID=46433 RepID=X6P2J2_RETFI|nr:ankyrin repeat-containing protein [Reticulomyxa filosa]|eukprot:ETO32353.1 ankyrin repeat-containing protein [Reticulomyxa filosa]
MFIDENDPQFFKIQMKHQAIKIFKNYNCFHVFQNIYLKLICFLWKNSNYLKRYLLFFSDEINNLLYFLNITEILKKLLYDLNTIMNIFLRAEKDMSCDYVRQIEQYPDVYSSENESELTGNDDKNVQPAFNASKEISGQLQSLTSNEVYDRAQNVNNIFEPHMQAENWEKFKKNLLKENNIDTFNLPPKSSRQKSMDRCPKKVLTRPKMFSQKTTESLESGGDSQMDMSSDSDSEEERISNKRVIANKVREENCKNLLKNLEYLDQMALTRCLQLDLSECANFTEPTHVLSAKADLQRLNSEFASAVEKGELKTLLTELSTRFVILQIRGITYSDFQWDARGRRFHRKLDEIDQPLFCNAAYEAAGIDFKKETSRQAIRKRYSWTRMVLQGEAERIKQFLIGLRQRKNVQYQGKTYGTDADVLEEIYTNEYGKFRDGNPHISTSDRPYHALRYAYGFEQEHLHPCWDENGQAQRGKSGKVYLSVHPLTDYGKHGPLSITDMVWNGRVSANSFITSTRETTFPGYLPAGRVKYVHIAKYPSFHRPYKKIFKAKYGLNKELYELFKKAVLKTALTPLNKNVEQLLGEWLSVYHEVKMIEWAENYAKSRNFVFVYRQPGGKFSFKLPPDPQLSNVETFQELKQKKKPHEDKKSELVSIFESSDLKHRTSL